MEKSKRKVLVLASTFPRWVGDTNPPFVFELSKRLVKQFEVSVLTPHYPGAKTNEQMSGLNVFRYRYFIEKFEKLAGNGGILPVLKKNKFYYLTVPFFILGQLLAAIKIIKTNRPDIIHAHWIIPQGLVAYILKKLFNIPYIITSHGGDIFGLQAKPLIKLKNIILDNSKRITVVSSAIKAEVLRINPTLENKIEIIPMGVDSKLFNPDKYDEKLKKQYSITGNFLLFVGRLAEKKGVKYLIAAMPAIIKKYPKTKLLIVGTGPLESELKNQVSSLKLEKSIIFTGAIKNTELPKFYATADIFIGPSIITKDGDTEGLGLTFVEAIFSGCKAIGTNIGGISDVLSKDYLIEQRNKKSISDKVIQILNKKNGNNIIEIVKKFDYKFISSKYAKEISRFCC